MTVGAGKPCRSVLGPQPTGEQRTTAETSGHWTFGETAARSNYSLLTSDGGDRCSGVRVSHLHQLGCCWAAVREDGRLADPSDLLDGAAHGVLLDDNGAPDPEKVKAAISELLARRPHYAKRISGDVGQGARPGQAERGAMGIIQSRTRQIRCYWYRRIIESGMTKS